ncbi:MAG: TrmH family RNA methyltransferase [Spirochaetota bacterium]
MITIRKLQSLPPGTRHRKIVRLLESWERSGEFPAARYRRELAASVEADPDLPAVVREAARALPLSDGDGLRRDANVLRHALMRHLGAEPADWDLLAPDQRATSGARAGLRLVGVSLYLESIRSPFNLGSIVRTAAAFGVATVCVSDDCPPLEHPRVLRSAMGGEKAVTLVRGSLDETLGGAGPVIALELGGEPVATYPFPSRGVLVLGSEELGVSPGLLARAEARVSIPLGGAKASLNVGVACGIALAAWQAASSRAR